MDEEKHIKGVDLAPIQGLSVQYCNSESGATDFDFGFQSSIENYLSNLVDRTS